MKTHLLFLTGLLALLTPSHAQLWPKPGGGFYPTNTTPAAGDYFQLWDAGLNATQQISVGTLDARWQGLDSDLTLWAGYTPSANGGALVSAANYAAMRGLLDLEAGTDFYSMAAAAAAFQAIEATLTDIADGTIAENLVNTANPWADNEVADAITITGSVAGGTVVASGFNGNLATTDDTVQEIAQKLDDLSIGGGFDATGVDAVTWSDGANASNTWTFNVSGTDPTLIFGNGIITVGGNLAVTGTSTFDSLDITGALDVGSLEIGGTAITSTGTELNYTDGVTSAIQTQLDAKAAQTAVDATAAGTHASPNTGAETPTWTGPTHTVWQGDAATINLPAAAGYANRGIIIYSTGANIITVEPNGSEVIVRDGTAQTGGVNFTLSAAAGNFVALISDGARWVTLGYKGTLTVGS